MNNQKSVICSEVAEKLPFFIGLLFFIFMNNGLFGQAIVINEFMSDNETTVADEDGDFSDWIELYNPSNLAVNLENYCLSDDENDLQKWEFPHVNIPAYGFIAVFASDKNRTDTTELHTNFKISKDGEVLFLSDATGLLIDQTIPIPLAEDEVYGRFPDGSPAWKQSFYASFCAPNLSYNHLEFSHSAGFFHAPFYLKITNPLEDSIYYTLDGSSPTPQSLLFSDSIFMDFRYDTPNFWSEIPTSPPQELISYTGWSLPDILLDKAIILKCASFENGIISSPVATQTFFVDSTLTGKYDLPVISIISDYQSLFSYDSGIYVPGVYYDSLEAEWTGNYFRKGDNWERQAHIEYFEPDGELAFSQDAGLRINGGKTRQAGQKSLRLYARNEYGKKYFNYPLLPGRDVDKYKRFVLRAAMGSWHGQCVINDVLAHDISRNLNIDYQEYQPAVVFINGEYWGIHTIRDRVDERYIEYTHGVDKDSVIFRELDTQLYNDLMAFIEENDLSIPQNYQYVSTQIDMSNYIDYQIAEMFFCNWDWPVNNNKCWRPNTSDGKWRWVFFDLDAGFGNYDLNMLKHNIQSDTSIVWPNSAESTFLFRNLIKNENFINQLTNRYAQILNQDFDTDTTQIKYDLLAAKYRHEMPSHCARWHFPERIEVWENDIQNIIANFLLNRPCAVEENIIPFFNLDSFGFSCDVSYPEIKTQDFFIQNPSDGNFFVSWPYSAFLRGKMMISTVGGNILFYDEDISFARNEKKYFHLPNLPGGLYFFSFQNSEFSSSQKLIIMH